jgi:prevent-host-death family protein
MAAQLDDFGPPKVLLSVSTNELRDNLSQWINRAVFGREPVLVTRRGRKIAAIISIADFAFLETMRQRRDEAMTEKLSAIERGHSQQHSGTLRNRAISGFEPPTPQIPTHVLACTRHRRFDFARHRG